MNMKTIIAVLVFCMMVSANAKSWFSPEKNLRTTPEEMKSYVVAFAKGLEIADVIKPSEECLNSSDDALNYAAAALDNFANEKYWEGTLNFSDSLGALSPLSRHCDNSMEELGKLIGTYPNQFKSWLDYLLRFAMNTIGNVKPLIDRYLFLYHYLGKGDTEAVSQTLGEVLRLHFNINYVVIDPLKPDRQVGPVSYTGTDPLAADPIPAKWWNIFESLFNLLVDSKFIGEQNLIECEGGALNWMVYTSDAAKNFKGNSNKAGLYSTVDSFQYIRPTIEGCTYTALEIGTRSELIDKEVIDNPSIIFKNIAHNVFEIVSDGLFGYAEYNYRDIISFFAAIGDFFYRTVTYSVENP